MKLGRLEEVHVRELWKHEQHDFSAWMVKPENIELINDVLGLTLVDLNQEVNVGGYRCDVVASDATRDITVVIENQLEPSNHDHLGKIITYASGLDAKVIVWIVTFAREEHRSAIEWLNNNTRQDVNFFLLEIKAYKIGDSHPAPKFEIIEEPNDFNKIVKNTLINQENNKSESCRLEFWSRFNELVAERSPKPFNTRKPTIDHWRDIALGKTKAHLNITLVNKSGFIGVSLWISDNKELYDELYKHKEAIEHALPFDLQWERADDKKSSSIKSKIDGLDFDNQENYEILMNQVIERVIEMKKVFKKYIR